MARLIKLMGKMILSMVSVVFGGVLNMLFVKTNRSTAAATGRTAGASSARTRRMPGSPA